MCIKKIIEFCRYFYVIFTCDVYHLVFAGITGFGYYRGKKMGGVKKYEGIWYPRTVFKKINESTSTKGESIAFQTPSLSGTIMRVYGYNGGVWRERKLFDTEAEAIAYVKGKAGILK